MNQQPTPATAPTLYHLPDRTLAIHGEKVRANCCQRMADIFVNRNGITTCRECDERRAENEEAGHGQP